jgi:hypothetical protein
MATVESHVAPSRLTFVQWAIVIIAAIGFAFDSYQLLMAPLFVRPALVELLGVPATSPLVNEWVGILFYVPAVAGGLFGLLGGYLADLFGRRRVLVWSICCTRSRHSRPAFDVGPVAAVLAVLHVCVCVEFVAAVAWLSELFPNPKQREAIVGYAGVRVDWRRPRDRCLLPRRHVRRATAGRARGPRSVAVHADVGHHPGHSPHHHPSVPAGISDVAPEET